MFKSITKFPEITFNYTRVLRIQFGYLQIQDAARKTLYATFGNRVNNTV